MRKSYLSLSIVFTIISTVSCVNNVIPLTNNKNYISSYIGTGISFQEYLKRRKDKFNNDFKNKKEKDNNIKSAYIDRNMQNNESSFNVKSTFVRRKVALLGSTPTQKSHENIDDKNIFDISKSESLQGLEIYQGDIINGDTKSSSLKIDNGTEVKFESDVVIIKFSNLNGLNLFKSLYNAQVVDEFEGYYKLRVDISKAPTEKVFGLLEKFNSNLSKNIENIDFSSLASFKLITILLDFMLNQNQHIKSIELNEYAKPTSVKININDWSFDSPAFLNPPNNSSIIRSWWLTQTNILSADNLIAPTNNVNPKAWNYSIGTKADVAVLDVGFNIKIGQNIQNETHDEFSRRVLLDKDNNRMDKNIFKNDRNNISQSPSNYHGTAILNVMAAERNNLIGSVGVAPNTFVSPYYISDNNSANVPSEPNKWDSARMVASSIKNNHKIINISSVVNYDFQFKLAETLSKINIFDPEAVYESQIKKAVDEKNIAVICGAGNDNKSISSTFPAMLSDINGLITIGGVDIVSPFNTLPNPTAIYTASESFDKKTNKIDGGSGYGNNMVWAPWQAYYLASHNKDIKGIYQPNQSNVSGGTSYASAFTSGVAALMLSRNDKLTGQQIEEILHKSASINVNRNRNMILNNFSDPNNMKLIDAEAAVIEAIKLKDSNYQKYQAQDKGIGYFELDSNALNNNSTNNKAIGKVTFNDGSTVRVMRTASDYEFTNANKKIVSLKGWESSITGFAEGFEVLNIAPLSVTKPNITEVTPLKEGFPATIKGTNLFAINNPVKLRLQNLTSNKIYESNISEKPTNNADILNFVFQKGNFREVGLIGPTPLMPIGNYSLEFIADETSNIYTTSSAPGVPSVPFKVLSTEIPQDITVNNKPVSVITSNSKTPIVSGSKIAVPLNSKLMTDLSNIVFFANGRRLTYLDVVNEYAILGVDTTIPQGAVDVFIKNLTGDTILTFEQALYKTAIAIGLKPLQPVSFPDGSSLSPDKFIDNNSKLSVKTGDTVGVAIRGDLENIKISIGGQLVTYKSIVDEYVAFKIPPNIPQGAQDVIIQHVGGENLTFTQALDILASQVMNIANNKIAYIGYNRPDYKVRLFTINPDGTENKQISEDGSINTFGWSPDKSKIAYSSQGNIFIINADGSNKIQLTTDGGNDLSWSHDGKKIIYMTSNYSDKTTSINVINSDGSNPREVKRFPLYSRLILYVSSSWSYDNNKIAYGFDYSLYSINIDGSDNKKLTSEEIRWGYPSWTKDNKLIYNNRQGIIKINADGSNPVVLATNADMPTLSLDGSKIAFRFYDENSYIENIYVMNVDGTNLRKVTNDSDFYIHDISWSAYNNALLYWVSPNFGKSELYTINIDGSNNQKLPVSLDIIYGDKWSVKNYKQDNGKDKSKKNPRISW